MAGKRRTADREAPLLALLDWEERLARWESVPPEAREALAGELARLMVRVAESGGARHDAGDGDPGTAS